MKHTETFQEFKARCEAITGLKFRTIPKSQDVGLMRNMVLARRGNVFLIGINANATQDDEGRWDWEEKPENFRVVFTQ